MVILPTLFDGTANYTFNVQLDNITYIFEFNWNDRQSAWFFNLLDANSNMLLAGRKVVLGLFMLTEFVSSGFPLGDLTAIDTGGTNQPPGLTELGNRVILYYFDTTDLADVQTVINSLTS
jgi:hypothetical protein